MIDISEQLNKLPIVEEGLLLQALFLFIFYGGKL